MVILNLKLPAVADEPRRDLAARYFAELDAIKERLHPQIEQVIGEFLEQVNGDDSYFSGSASAESGPDSTPVRVAEVEYSRLPLFAFVTSSGDEIRLIDFLKRACREIPAVEHISTFTGFLVGQ